MILIVEIHGPPNYQSKYPYNHFHTGLFANRSFEKGTFVSFYNGIRMLADDLDEDSKEVDHVFKFIYHP